MTVRSKSYLQALFVTGYVPTSADLADLIDSYADSGSVGTGAVVQSKAIEDATVFTSASGSFVDTGFAIQLANATGATTRKQRVRFSFSCACSAIATLSFTIKRDSTDLAGTVSGTPDALATAAINGADFNQQVNVEFEDTPGDTTAHTYKLYAKTSGGTLRINNLSVGGYATALFAEISEIDPTPSLSLGGAVALLSDVKSSGTDGGTSSTSYATRTLNTEVDPYGIVALASNVFTLQPGRYLIKARAPAYNSGQHKIRLYNVTGSAVEAVGDAGYSGTSGTGADRDSHLSCIVEPGSTTAYRIEHRVTTPDLNNGLGVNAGFGDNEVYTQVEITRLGA